MISFFFQTLWLYILAGIGEKGHKSPMEENTVIAAFMLYSIFYNVSAMEPAIQVYRGIALIVK